MWHQGDLFLLFKVKGHTNVRKLHFYYTHKKYMENLTKKNHETCEFLIFTDLFKKTMEKIIVNVFSFSYNCNENKSKCSFFPKILL